ncbi:MAG: hypothetical protein M3Y49_17640, partial [Actinomycetota bacterium]|nr:hypothetical protein [Actinomycetota bacterium]
MQTSDAKVRGRVWRGGKVVAEEFDFARISDYLNDQDTLTWVDLCDPDHRLLQELAEELTLEPLAVEDAIAHSERAKATRYATHTFMTGTAPGLVDTRGGLFLGRVCGRVDHLKFDRGEFSKASLSTSAV